MSDASTPARWPHGSTLLLSLAALHAACTSGPASDAGDVATDRVSDAAPDAVPPDAMVPDAALDAPAPDTTPDVLALDIAPPDALALDATPEVPAPDASAPPTLLLLGASNLPSHPALSSAFRAGLWQPLTSLPDGNAFANGGGGVTMLPDGRGLAVVRSGSFPVQSTLWSAGGWDPVTTLDSARVVSPVLASPDGALFVQQSATGTYPLSVYRFSPAGSSWTAAAGPAIVGNLSTIPALALTGTGDLLVLDATLTSYQWSLRTGTTWSAPATIAGLTAPMLGVDPVPSIAMTTRAGTNQALAVFSTRDAATHASGLVSETFSAGVWSAATPVASDAYATVSSVNTPAMLAPLPDGRVALAYLTATRALSVAFFNGSSWSTPRAVPGVTSTASASVPFALTRGADSTALLELVSIDASFHLQHTRLTDEAGWTWSAPVSIDASSTCVAVWTAVRP